MRGFHPAEARASAKNYADGGVVHSIKGMLGFRPRTPDELRAADAKAQERNQAAAAKVAARQVEAAAPATAPQAALSQYSGMTALQRREKEAGYADGGMVRGPGSGTSDDVPDEVPEGTYIMPADSTDALGADKLAEMGSKKVPVNLSNGEFKMPPEQVHAVGVQALDQMKAATHTPVRGFAPQAQPEEPRQFFANGGVVTDEEKQRLANQTSMYVQGAQASAASRPAVPPAAPAPAAPAQTTAAPVAAGFMPGTRAVFNESGKAIGDLAGQGRYGAAAGETARAALAYGPALVDDVVGGAFRAAAPAVADAGKQFFGLGNPSAQAPQDPLAAAPTAPPVPAPQAAQAPAPAPVATAQPSVATPPSAAAPAPGAVTRNGNSYSGTNVTGDVSINGAAPRNGGQISAQNMAAADALAGRQSQESTARVQQAPAGFAPTNMSAPVVRNSTKDWAARKALENAATSASSITNNGGRFDRSGPGDSVAMAGFKAMLGTDQALQQAQVGLEQEGMRQNGGLQREALQQTGGLQREQVQQAGANNRADARNAMDGRRIGLEEQVRGFDIREGQRKEKLYESYGAAKTPEEKAAIAQQIRDLSGKQAESPWKLQVTPTTKNVDGSTTDGSIYRYNTQTGAVERVDAGNAAPQPMPAKDQLKSGQVYQTPRGPARWDGKQFTSV